MAGVVEKYPEFEVPVTFLQAERASQHKIHHMIVSVYGQNIFS
jgi:hypothetical protein